MSKMEKRLWHHPVSLPSEISTKMRVSQNKGSPKLIQLTFLFNETLANLCVWKGPIFSPICQRVPSFGHQFLGLTLQRVVLQQLQKHGLTWQRTHSLMVLCDADCVGKPRCHWRAESWFWMVDYRHSASQFEAWRRHRVIDTTMKVGDITTCGTECCRCHISSWTRSRKKFVWHHGKEQSVTKSIQSAHTFQRYALRG